MKLNINYNRQSHDNKGNTIGYHETLTRFWISKIYQFINFENYENLIDACRAICFHNLFNMEYPLKYYSKTQLYSEAAKQAYINPQKTK